MSLSGKCACDVITASLQVQSQFQWVIYAQQVSFGNLSESCMLRHDAHPMTKPGTCTCSRTRNQEISKVGAVVVEFECIIFLCSFVEGLDPCSLWSLLCHSALDLMLFLIRFGVNVISQPALANVHLSNFGL